MFKVAVWVILAFELFDHWALIMSLVQRVIGG